MVLDIKKFSGNSSTNWEDSFYGGYIKMLYDLPEVVIGDGTRLRLESNSKISYYLGHKIVRLFLFKIRESNLTIDLLFNSRIQEVEGLDPGESIGRYLVLSNEALDKALKKLIAVEREYSSLFLHYAEVISTTSVMFKVRDDVFNPIELAKVEMASIGTEMIDLESKVTGYRSVIHNEEFKPVFKIVPIGKAITYSNEEKRYIHELTQRLDISFDSDRDMVRGLKQGKIDTHKLAEVLANNDRIYSRVLEDQKTKPFRVVILCDESGSMWQNARIPMQYKLVKVLYGALSSIMPSDHLFIYGHTGMDLPEIFVYHDCYNQNFENTIQDMYEREYAQNYDGPVIEKIYDRIRSITDDSILMIVVSDGSPCGNGYGGTEAIEELKRIIEKCKRDNFVIMGLGFEYAGVKDIYSYHAVIDKISKVVESTTVLLNKVVKTEFK